MYRHKQGVQLILSSDGSSRNSPEYRATQSILIPVSPWRWECNDTTKLMKNDKCVFIGEQLHAKIQRTWEHFLNFLSYFLTHQKEHTMESHDLKLLSFCFCLLRSCLRGVAIITSSLLRCLHLVLWLIYNFYTLFSTLRAYISLFIEILVLFY